MSIIKNKLIHQRLFFLFFALFNFFFNIFLHTFHKFLLNFEVKSLRCRLFCRFAREIFLSNFRFPPMCQNFRKIFAKVSQKWWCLVLLDVLGFLRSVTLTFFFAFLFAFEEKKETEKREKERLRLHFCVNRANQRKVVNRRLPIIIGIFFQALRLIEAFGRQNVYGGRLKVATFPNPK